MLQAADLQCERGGRTLFKGLNLEARKGDLLRVSGPNGSGKTSLLRILCGLAAPSAGEVRWNGIAIGSLKEEYARELVYLGHAPAVKADLTAAENLSVACTLAGETGAEVRAALARFGVPPDVPLRKLSEGQRRRAALARLAARGAAPLWILDEPFSALDTEGASLLKELFENHLAGGGAIVFTTHQDPGIAATRTVELG